MGRMSVKNGRIRANARERSRMHNLNRAIDRLRSYIPLSGDFQSFDVLPSSSSETNLPSSTISHSSFSSPCHSSSALNQNKFSIRTKLSKIETLRLARNYLVLLTELSNNNISQNRILIGQILGYGLGQHSLNQIATLLNVEGSGRLLSQTPESVKSMFQNYCGTCHNTQEYSSIQNNKNNCTQNDDYSHDYSYDLIDFW